MHALNETHDPQLQSWVASANDGQTDFPIQNLPFAIFRRQGSNEAFRGGVAIGDQIVDMAAAVKAGVTSTPTLVINGEVQDLTKLPDDVTKLKAFIDEAAKG